VSARTWSLLFAVILAGSECVYSQEEDTVEKRTELATVEGRAVNSVAGEPFARESITLRALPPGTEAWVVQSDADGRFTFEEMEPGSYVLCVRRIGDDGLHLKLSAGQVLKDVEFKVTPPGSIRGSVVDEEGKPLPRAMVFANGGINKPSGGFASADSAGEFRFPNLLPGSYVLKAIPMGGRLAPGKAEERLLPTYYPGATDSAGAVPLEVAAGQELQGITIVVRKGRLYHVQGTVLPPSPDTPLADVRLSFWPRSQVQVPAIVIVSSDGNNRSAAGGPAPTAPRRDGSFDLGDVWPGSYYLTASRQGLPRVILGSVQVDINDADVAGVVLRIGEPRQIQGTMRMEGKDKPDFTGVRVSLRSLDSPGSSPSAAVDAENAFTLKDVPPDRQLVVVMGLPERDYVKSIRLGGQEAIETGLDLTDMPAVPPLDILISPNGATVEGTVNQDDKPSPGAWVCLAPDSVRLELVSKIKFATATGDGKFSFAGVAPGEYRLYAFGPLKRNPNPYVDLEFLKPFESKAMKLSVKEGERKQAEVKALKLEWMGK
jgi:hypothetical protein